MQRSSLSGAALSLLLLGFFVLTGCDNTVEPFSERGVYSIYGYLGVNETVQVVRVKPLTKPLTSDTSTIDATVSLTNLSTGTTKILKDSVITFREGNQRVPTHNFWGDFTVAPNTKYRLTVERSDGVTAEATTVTPTEKEPTIIPSEGHCRKRFRVNFRDVKERQVVETSISFVSDSTTYNVPRTESVFENAAGETVMRFTPEVVLKEHIDSVDDPETRCDYEPRCWELDKAKLEIEYTYLGPEWFGNVPEDSLRFDPLESEDVTNGLGFFGSLRRDETSVTVDTTNTIPIDNIRCP